MKIKIASMGIIASLLVGCAGHYKFAPDRISNPENVVINHEEQIAFIEGADSSIEIQSLEKEVGPWKAPRMRFKITNLTENRIMNVKAKDIRVGFNNFWFDIIEYKIIRENDIGDGFVNNENFKLEHEVLPGEDIIIEATFKTPKSQEYYTKHLVLIEVYTNLGMFNVNYRIRKEIG